jgi:hypothetical protein
MKSFIYVDILEKNDFVYGHEVSDWVKREISGASLFDMDNFSEELIRNYALQLVEESHKTVFYFNVRNEVAVKRMLGFIEKILEKRKKILFVIEGKAGFIEVLAAQYGVGILKVPEAQNLYGSIKSFLTG